MFSNFKKLLVIDLSSVLAGPAVGQFFAELGATVLKIENYTYNGDVTRSWKLKTEDPKSDISAYFLSTNWGKKSIAIDLSKFEGQKIVQDLAKKADVLIHNFKKNDDKKFNLDYKTISKLNPEIIYAAICGFSESSERTGYDAIIQAESGFISMNGRNEKSVHKMPVALMDVLAAHQLKEAILVSLIKRYESGKGEKITVSLMDSAISSLLNQASNYLNAGHIPKAIGSDHPNIVPYGTHFRTRDSVELIFAIGSDKQFNILLSILDLKELQSDPRFLKNINRVKNKKALLKILQNKIATMSSESIYEPCLRLNIPVGKVLKINDVLEDQEHKNLIYLSGTYKAVRQFVASNRSEKKLKKPPSFSADSKEILCNVLFYSEEEIEQLKMKKIVQL